MSRTVSSSGLALVKKFEGFIAEPAPLAEGLWVVGHGHVRAGEPGAGVTAAEAEALLVRDLAPVVDFLNQAIAAKLTQSQFDALASFAISIGLEAFAQSAVLRRVQAGQMLAAACAMDAWRKSDASGELEVLGVLVLRRAAEKAIFLKGAKILLAPSAFLRPQMDHAVSILGAPIAFAATPGLDPKAVAPSQALAVIDPGVRITEILKSEPATAALLLTQVVVDVDEETDEIVTAHAKPVARAVIAAPQRKASGRKFWRWPVKNPVETFGLGALMAFGLGLAALAVATLSDRADLVDALGACALGVPGLLAMAMAGLGFARAPKPIAA